MINKSFLFETLSNTAPGSCLEPEPDPKVYVMVRRDLPWPVRTVQAAHAVMQLIREVGFKIGWGTYGPAVVLLGVTNEVELKKWFEQLSPNVVSFHEPDMMGQLTSIAYYGPRYEALDDLKLL